MKTSETQNAYRILDLDETERPRERLANLGAGALKAAELLAILLRVGMQGENAVQVGERLLNECGGLAGLQRTSYAELCNLHGIGPAKAAQIKAAIELGNRLAQLTSDVKPAINSPRNAADLVLYEMCALEQEELWVLLLDTRNRLIEKEKAYRGSLNASTVRVGEIFKTAIRRNAAALIVVHNHPSGDPTPSPEDIALTRSLTQAGKLLDIDVLDHLVVGGNQFVSLKERGLGFASA